jgi:hypothetical protein
MQALQGRPLRATVKNDQVGAAGSNPCHSDQKSPGFFVLISILGQVGGRDVATLSADGRCRPVQVVGMMAATSVLQTSGTRRATPQLPGQVRHAA